MDDVFTPDDVAFEHPPLRIVMNRHLLPAADGLMIDFCRSAERSAFVLYNPSSQDVCPCGASFDAELIDFYETDSVEAASPGSPVCPLGILNDASA